MLRQWKRSLPCGAQIAGGMLLWTAGWYNSLSLLKHSCFLPVPRPADFSPLLPSEVFTAWPKCNCLKQKVENFGCFGASVSPSACSSASSASWSPFLWFFSAWFRAHVSSLLVLCPLFPCCKYIALHQNEINFKNCGA